ncbi:unnamed protein product, partial [Amoebophrya sp. A25]
IHRGRSGTLSNSICEHGKGQAERDRILGRILLGNELFGLRVLSFAGGRLSQWRQ